jgi:formamidopyrimidine-DNA glycosylase
VPELPDIAVYVEQIERLFVGQTLLKLRLASPFVLRTAIPPISDVIDRPLLGVRRLGKRLVFSFGQGAGKPEAALLVVHLMVAGRFKLLAAGGPIPKKLGLAAFDFANGSLLLTEAGTKRRASMHYVSTRTADGSDPLAPFNRGGLEPLSCTAAEFKGVLTRENHTLKRALTDPTILSGIGNGYSDEILHLAKLSPLKQTNKLTAAEWEQLFMATQTILNEWIERLRNEAKDGFPENVTAFRKEMRVHGKYKQPCPTCGALVLRIVYADNETNYCAGCQTGGKPLADRSMSRLLGKDWPKSLEELEELRPSLLGKPNPARSTKPARSPKAAATSPKSPSASKRTSVKAPG